MKHLQKRLLALCLVMCLLMAGMPSIGASAEKENAVPEQTSSVNWEELFSAGRSNFTLPEEGTYAPNRLLVTRMENPQRNSLLYHSSIESRSELFSLPMPQEVQAAVMTLDAAPEEQIVSCTALSLVDGSDMLAVMEDLSQQEGVLAVELDRLYTISDEPVTSPAPVFPEDALPNRDPLVAQQTWLDTMGATKAWDILTAQGKVPGAGVTVAVLDSGITIDHPDLKDQIAEGGCGFIFNTETDKIELVNDYEDDNGHGTHVSGIIAGAKNGTGITGVAYGAKILPVKILYNNSGHSSAIVYGMQYAAGLVNQGGSSTPNGKPRCDIINMSLGGNSGQPSLAYEIAASAVREAGVFIVVSAGNEETSTSYVHPANIYSRYTSPAYFPDVFTVMAMKNTPAENGDYLTAFSNWDTDPYAGAEYTIMAPGYDMLSSVNEELYYYRGMSGTSMASPAVAGAAALLLSTDLNYSTDDLWSMLATSGKKLQGKTAESGSKYYYHSLDVVAAMNTNPDDVHGVVNGTVTGKWDEAFTPVNDIALVVPMDGSLPELQLTLRGYDAKVSSVNATSPDLNRTYEKFELVPGGEKTLVFTLKEPPTEAFFETDITVTWRNRDGTTGSREIHVGLPVIQAVSGEKLLDPVPENAFETIWVFDKPITIDMKNAPASPPSGSFYCFGEEGSLNITNTAAEAPVLEGSYMLNPQISGNVELKDVTIDADIQSQLRLSSSTIDVKSMVNCRIDGYDNLNLTVKKQIEGSTISNCTDTLVQAGSIYNNSFVNDFSFDTERCIEITVTDVTAAADAALHSGFCHNAVVGPATVLYFGGPENLVSATVQGCYFLPTNDDDSLPIWLKPENNKLSCAMDSTVYIEGKTEGVRPAMLADCPTFLISTKRAVGEDGLPIGVTEKNYTMSYRLESIFSRAVYIKGEEQPPQLSYVSALPPFGNLPAENVLWAEDGASCTYTVYTSSVNVLDDDFYSLRGIGIIPQYDYCNSINSRSMIFFFALGVVYDDAAKGFTLAWPEFSEAMAKSLNGVLIWGPFNGDETTVSFKVANHLGGITIPCDKPKEGSQHSFYVRISDVEPEEEASADAAILYIGRAIYNKSYDKVGEKVSLVNSEGNAASTLNLSGTESVTLTLRAEKSFNLENGLKAMIAFDGESLELTSVAPSMKAFSGVAQQGDTAVAEIAPTSGYVLEGDALAKLTFRGKNVASKDQFMFIHLLDFMGKNVEGEMNDAGEYEAITFALSTGTTARSSGGDYTPPTQDSTTLPDGTLVTTVKNPDGSIQIVYVRPDGVRSTVKTPAKGGQSSASIALPADMAGKSVSVPIPMAQGNITTVAVLVGTDGKEQVLPGSYWKNGVLTVPLTGNANIIIRDNAKTFTDLKPSDWFAAGVAFATSHELFSGTGNDKFSPGANMTRGMLVTVLARLDGQDTTTGERWDSAGIAWAKKLGISDGMLMNNSITREQLALMLYRYAKAEKVEGTSLDKFSDSASVSVWAADAMNWAIKTGIISGTDGKLNPGVTATRAEVSAMLARFIAK